jgi:hypothetical protein
MLSCTKTAVGCLQRADVHDILYQIEMEKRNQLTASCRFCHAVTLVMDSTSQQHPHPLRCHSHQAHFLLADYLYYQALQPFPLRKKTIE